MWRIWQLCLYVYCVTLQNRIGDKHMNALTLKLLDAYLLLNYFGGFFISCSFKVNFFVIVLLYLVSLQKIVMKSYSTPEQFQNSVFKNAHLILASFGWNRIRYHWMLSDCHCFVLPAQELDCSREPFRKIHHKNTGRKLVNTSLMQLNRLSLEYIPLQPLYNYITWTTQSF